MLSNTTLLRSFLHEMIPKLILFSRIEAVIRSKGLLSGPGLRYEAGLQYFKNLNPYIIDCLIKTLNKYIGSR